MRVRSLDHARGLLRKLQNERHHWLSLGADEDEVDSYYGPKIAAMEREIDRLSQEAEDDQDLFRPTRKGKSKEGRKKFRPAYR